MQLVKLSQQPPAIQAAVVLLTLLPFYLVSYQYRIRHPYGEAAGTTEDLYSSAAFTRDWLDTHVISPYDPSPLKSYCNHTEWHPNLIFNLDNANGGIGNVRGNLLDFLFFAVEAGASILLPGMVARSEEELGNVWGSSRLSFDAFFDEEWFVRAMADACPQMKVYKPESHATLSTALPGKYTPPTRRMDLDKVHTKKAYLEHLDAWLKDVPDFRPDKLTLVNLERTLWEVDTRNLPLGLRRNFGQVMRINPAIRRLAALVVESMANRYQLNLEPRDGIPKQAFFGAHLRTESDAKNVGWLDDPHTNFTAQTNSYIDQAVKHKLSVVYVASGNATELGRFQRRAASHHPPLNVTSKFDLLPENEAASLRKLSWDQQALVDWEVLQRCSIFGGIAKSSFSYNIALTRNQRLEDEGRVMDPWFVLHKEVGVGFDDGISRLLGRYEVHERRIPRGMWP